MSTYCVTLSTGAEVLIEAHSPADARAVAEQNAALDGYPGIAAVEAERVDDERAD